MGHPYHMGNDGYTAFCIARMLGDNADSTAVPLKANNDYEVLRNIAYLHAIHKLIVIGKLRKALWIRHETETLIAHVILTRNKHTTQ